MYKKSNNPKIEELTKTETVRQYPLSKVQVIKIEGTRFCVWCAEKQLFNKNQKYCSKECSINMMAWGYPQKEEGLSLLLMRQDWCCNICKYDYKPFIEQNIINKYYGTHSKNDLTQFNFYLIKRLKNKIDKALLPEVDHITPISKGGQSLGLENHQAICYTCHKAKSKIDNSGPRKKKVDKISE